MKEYTCNECGKFFNQKSDYDKHQNKKYPCIPKSETIKSIISDDIQLSRLEQLFNKIRDILRNNENIVGVDSFDIITDFLLLRILKSLLIKNEKNPNATYIDMAEYNYSTDADAQTYKKYIIWDNLIEKVNTIHTQKDKDDLDYIVRNAIFKGIFRNHPSTADIFREKPFLIKKTATIILILNEFIKFDANGTFENLDVDIKGKAYELTIQKEASTNKSFGQFFTPRWIVKYMVEQLNPKVNSDGTYDKIMDPACGTAGFLTEYYKYIKHKCDEKDILIDKNVQNYINGYEIVARTREIAMINILINTGIYNNSIKRDDFLEQSYNYIKKPFNGHILTNPPFSIEKNYESLMSNNEITKHMFPIKTKSGTFLFVQACIGILADGYKCCLVSPNGKEIFNKNKEFVEIRKYLMEKCNLYKVVYYPSQSFKPYTGVETMALFFEKGKPTTNIEFYNVDKDKKGNAIEKKIINVDINKIVEKSYSLNVKEYIDANKNNTYNTTQYILSELCSINYGTRITKTNNTDGQYPVYGGGDITFYTNNFNRENITLVISRFGVSEKCVRIIKGHIFLNDSALSIVSKNNEICINAYINYYMFINQNIIYSMCRGSAQRNLDMELFKNFEIKLPPLEIQQEIVKQLDGIYGTIDGIKKSMEKYNITRFEIINNKLDKIQTKYYNLGDIIDINYGTRIIKSDNIDGGEYPVYGGGGITFYTNTFNREGWNVIIGRFGVSEKCVRIIDKKIYLNDNGFSVKSNSDIFAINKFV